MKKTNTKLYFKDNKLSEILWNRYITNFKTIKWESLSDDIESFSERLKKAIIYIKKNNKEKLKIIYSKLFKEKENNINNIITKISTVIDKAKENNNKNILFKIYDTILNIWVESEKIVDFEMEDIRYALLTNFSKTKFLWYKLKERYPKKENETNKEYKCRLKKIIKEIKEIYETDNDILDDMYNMGLDNLYYQIALHFIESSNSNSIENILENYQVDENNIPIIIKYLNESWVNPNIIQKLKDAFELKEELKPNITAQADEKVNWENIDSLQQIEKAPRKTITDFNPFLIPLDFETWIKTLWYNRFLEVYEKIFYWIAKDFLQKFGCTTPSFNKFLKFDINKLQNNKDANEKKYTFQYIIEFDTKDFDIKDLRQLAILLNEEIWDINLLSPTINQQFKHPLTTLEGTTKYDGYFSDSGEWFADNNIILLKWEKWEQKIRLTLSTFSQDEYIYLLTQIWYFIKNKKFIDKNQLYFNIYDSYNQTLFNDKLFDITILKENYEQFVRNIILPLSKDGLKLGLKANNILLAWLYGTWKSQFLKHMLLKKEWEFKWKKFILNANIIPIWLQEFKALLLQGIWGIKTRLDEIYQNTSTPIVLLVEDLDTLINEKAFWVNDELAQAMTLFFEWLGSLPVNVITTSNDPTKFSERLIRPNRISKILVFNRPNIEEKKKILNEHLKSNNINLDKEQLKIIYNSSIFKKWTPSHIWEIVKEIKNYIIIEWKLLWKKVELSKETIEKIINKIPVPAKDLDEKEYIINNWYKEISWKGRWKVGFKVK